MVLCSQGGRRINRGMNLRLHSKGTQVFRLWEAIIERISRRITSFYRWSHKRLRTQVSLAIYYSRGTLRHKPCTILRVCPSLQLGQTLLTVRKDTYKSPLNFTILFSIFVQRYWSSFQRGTSYTSIKYPSF